MKNKLKNLLLWGLFCSQLGFTKNGFSQPIQTVLAKAQLTGYILSKDSLKALPNVAVLNKSSHMGTTSNPFGYFNITMTFGDTIQFSSVGYGRKYFYFKRDLLAQNYNIQVLMSNDTVELKTFVFRDPDYQAKLKKEFDRYFTADSLAAFKELSHREMLKNRGLLYNVSELQHPITYFYERYNKQARQWNKIDRYRRVILKAQEDYLKNVKDTTSDYYSR